MFLTIAATPRRWVQSVAHRVIPSLSAAYRRTDEGQAEALGEITPDRAELHAVLAHIGREPHASGRIGGTRLPSRLSCSALLGIASAARLALVGISS
jgi:hypothetical protein